MASSELKVAYLGLGSMGTGMAKNILKHGFKLVVWNRTASKANDLVAAGARLATSPQEAVVGADVVISCLFDDKSCLALIQGENSILNGIQKGAVHVNTTTISPMVATELQQIHEKHGAHYVAGPVLGRPDVAAAGQLRSFLAGAREAIERARPVVASYSAGTIIDVGENPAQANVVKLSANMMLLANISLFGQVYALNEKWGVDHEITRQLISTFVSHPGLLAYEERVRNRNYVNPKGDGFGVDGGLKDVGLMQATGAEVGVPLPFCSVVRDQAVSVIGHGLKDLDWSAIADAARINAGLPLPSRQSSTTEK